MYKGKKVSLVFPAYNEEKNIGRAIEDFKSIKFIDEIIVINNNSHDKTEEVAKRTGAKVILEKIQGYGFALRRGLKEANGDLIVLCEPDGTFYAQDLLRLLPLTESFDLVMGTRTNNKFIQRGANMGFFLRFGNISVAKFMQLLYGLPNISDCGCTFRIFRKGLVHKIQPYFNVGSSHFLPESVVLTKIADGKIVEIPVRYGKRVGESKITGSFKKSVKVGLNMLGVILKYKINPPEFKN